jgi:hypothetical protein
MIKLLHALALVAVFAFASSCSLVSTHVGKTHTGNPWTQHGIFLAQRRVATLNSDFKNYKPSHAVSTLWNPWEWEI